MKFRELPRTELVLPEVGFGVWTVATNWWGKISEATRASLLENALELGVNFFDTADTYGEGFGEEILAKVLGHRRKDMIISTKFRNEYKSLTGSLSPSPANRAFAGCRPITSTSTRFTTPK